MTFFHFKKVLCLSPHPDDIEYSMAGTILKFGDTKFDIFCLTAGGDFDPTTKLSRHDEVRDAWKAISAKTNIELFFSPHKMIKDAGVDAWINYIEKTFDISSYDCIMIPTAEDSHFEHAIVSGFGYALIREKPVSIMEYYSPSTLETWIPNIFVGVSEVYAEKIKMLREFKSQQHRLYFNETVLDEFHTHYQQSKRGISKVEKFRLITTTIK